MAIFTLQAPAIVDAQIDQDAKIAAVEADVTALQADKPTQDSLIALNATKAEVALIKADNDAQDPFTSFTRQPDNSIDWAKESGATGSIAAPTASSSVADPDADPLPDAVAPSQGTPGKYAAQDHVHPRDPVSVSHEGNAELHLPQTNGANQYVKRNAAGDGWETVDLAINPANLIAGAGAPVAGDGEDGFYYQQIDAALGTNDIWGPKAAGAWPAQADAKSADPEIMTNAQAIATTGPDHITPRLSSPENWDAWGVSRRVQRIFNVGGAFDFTGLGYADRTAIFVRNTDRVNGIPITYGAGGAITREIVNASGLAQSVAGQDSFMIEPGEFIVMEKDGNTVHVSVLPVERVSYFDDYADAATNAVNRVTYDGFALIRDTGEMYGRKTTVNSVAFPVDGKPNADWFRVGDAQPDPQSLLLNYINVEMRSAGTNAGSRVDLDFVDIDGNTYPHGDWAYSADLTQYAGGTATIVTDKALYTGGIALGRNKQGTVKFYYTGSFPNGLSTINATPSNGGSTQGVQISYLGTNYNDDLANVAAVAADGPFYWTTSQEKVTATDQAAPWIEDVEYPVGTIISHEEANPADDNLGELFNWRVTTQIDANEFAVWDDTNFATIQGRLERFAIGRIVGGDASRVVPDGTNIGLDSFEMSTNETSKRFIIRAGTSATFIKNSNPAIVEVLGDDSLVTLTDVAGTSRTALVTAPADSDVVFEYQRNSTQFNFIVNSLAGGSSANRIFDSIADTDNESFKDGEVITTRSEGEGAVNWVFELGATEGDYELADVVSGYFNKLREQTQVVVLDADGGADNIASFSQADANFGDFVNDLDPTAKFYYVKRNTASTAQQSFDGGVTTVIPADDFDWYFFRRVNISTVEFMGKPFSDPTVYGTIASTEIGTLKHIPNVKEDGSAKTNADYVADGFLPLVNGFRLTDGATNNPKFALMFPTFVSGNDLLVPNLDGAFVRNLGGNAAAFMSAQADATAVNGLSSTLRTRSTAGGNGFNHTVSAFTNTATNGQQGSVINSMSGDTETRSFNFAMQFVLVLDSYSKVLMVDPELAAVEDGRIEIPVGDNSLVSDQWSVTNVGFDLTATAGRLVLESDLSDLSIELPVKAGKTYFSGAVRANEAWQIRAQVSAGSSDLRVATGYTAANGGTTTLDRIWYYPPNKTVIRPEDVAITQQVIGTALIEDRGIFREIEEFEPAGGTAGTVDFPEGGFASAPPNVSPTAQTNGHTININNITATGFSYDQWDVEDVKQGGAFSYSVKGLKP